MSGGSSILYNSFLPEADAGGKEIIDGIKAGLASSVYRLIVHSHRQSSPEKNIATEGEIIRRCVDDPDIAGVILVPYEGSLIQRVWSHLRESRKPAVFLLRLPSSAMDFDLVGVDDFTSAYQVVRHLISLGHRSIAHITNEEQVSSVSERLRGYRRALEEAGIAYRRELVVPHDNDEEGKITVSAGLLGLLRSLPQPPTAIFAVHDHAAFQALLSAHLAGLRIPQDLAVAGFDGLESLWGQEPALTTARQPFEPMGERAVTQLLARLRGDSGAVRHIYLEAPLLVSDSTVAVAGSSPLLVRSAWRARVVRYQMINDLSRAYTLEQLAAVARVSVSTLMQDFRTHMDSSPLNMLQELRLEKVHWDLSHPRPGMTVSHCASRWGLRHLGRFSTAYKKQYGESPSETLHRARASREPAGPG